MLQKVLTGKFTLLLWVTPPWLLIPGTLTNQTWPISVAINKDVWSFVLILCGVLVFLTSQRLQLVGSVIWVPVHFVIHNTTCPIKGATGCSKEAIGAFHYFPFETLLALPVVNQQKNLLSQSETHGCKVNPQTLNSNGKRKKKPTHLWSSSGVLFVYLFLSGRLSRVV